MSPPTNFKNKMPSHRKKNELLVIIIIGAISISVILFYTYLNNSPLNSDLPAINIISEGDIIHDDYIDCKFELNSEYSKDYVSLMDARIKIRGHANAKDKVPKKGYRLELTEEKSLLGMQKDDDWHLLAMYYDFPRMRIKSSFELWRSLKSLNPTAILPDSEYVRLYINGEFQGLYLLTERVDQKLFGLDDAQNSIDSSLVFQNKKISNFQQYDRTSWQQDWPNEDEDIFIMDQIMTDLFDFVSNTSDEVFFNPDTGIYTKFDKLNLIDFMLYNIFINHKDFWNTNYYIVRNSNPSKFYLIPWDFDGSFGQRGWIFFDFDENLEETISQKNLLFTRLIKNKDFMQVCENRWIYLREEIWTNEFIFDMVLDIYDEIKDFIQIDTQMWKPITVKDESLVYNRYLYSTKEFDLEEYINKLLEFIPERLEYCDLYFSEKYDNI